MDLKLSNLEQKALGLLLEKSPSAVSIDEIIARAYAPEEPPKHARASIATIMRSLIRKAVASDSVRVTKTSPNGRGHVARYQAVRREETP